MNITLNNKDYLFLTNYQKESTYRHSFNSLAKRVFGITFEQWYKDGYWQEKYTPYTLFDGEHAVANVSINIMDFNVLGETKRYIQIGTVMTDEQYRGRHLSRFLMQHVMQEWNEKCDFIYLFANPKAIEMYPKFGFSSVQEYTYFKPILAHPKSQHVFTKLNIGSQENRDFLYDYAKNSKVFSQLSLQENADLVMFYCVYFLQKHVYYSESLDTIVIAMFHGPQIQLWDIFSKQDVDLEEVLSALITQETKEIEFGFTPKDCSAYQVKKTAGDDTLFIQNNKTSLFEKNKIMFPLLSHA